MANMAMTLQKHTGDSWTLVLPPWGRVKHWKNGQQGQGESIQWSRFFDVESFNQHLPVMEFNEYLKVKPDIDLILYLQDFEVRYTGHHTQNNTVVEEQSCLNKDRLYGGGYTSPYTVDENGVYRGWFWGYPEVYAREYKCLSLRPFANIVPWLLDNVTAASVMIERTDQIHYYKPKSDHSAHVNFWSLRRSMRYARHLMDAGDEFRRDFLNSDDVRDKTELTENWKDMRPEIGHALGGPYLAVHLRRGDYNIRGDRKDVPIIEAAAIQVEQLLVEHGLDVVFLSSDGTEQEIEDFKTNLSSSYRVVRNEPSEVELEKYLDGGVAIIDQWICAHARYFIGTGLSTFSSRIMEERRILGFDPKMTLNRFCGQGQEPDCRQPWIDEVVYE